MAGEIANLGKRGGAWARVWARPVDSAESPRCLSPLFSPSKTPNRDQSAPSKKVGERESSRGVTTAYQPIRHLSVRRGHRGYADRRSIVRPSGRTTGLLMALTITPRIRRLRTCGEIIPTRWSTSGRNRPARWPSPSTGGFSRCSTATLPNNSVRLPLDQPCVSPSDRRAVCPESKLDWSLNSTWTGVRLGVEEADHAAHFEWLGPMAESIGGGMEDFDWNINDPRNDPNAPR